MLEDADPNHEDPIDPVAAAPDPASHDPAAHVPATHDPAGADLEVIERDLDGVEHALRRLDDGSYWIDEVTGHPLPDELLAGDPVARRAT